MNSESPFDLALPPSRYLFAKSAKAVFFLLVLLLPYNYNFWLNDFWNIQKILGLSLIALYAAAVLSGESDIPMNIALPLLLLCFFQILSILGVGLEGKSVEWRAVVSWAQGVVLILCISSILRSYEDMELAYKAIILSILFSTIVSIISYLFLLQLWSSAGLLPLDVPRMGGGYGDRTIGGEAGRLGWGGSSAYSFQLAVLFPFVFYGALGGIKGDRSRYWGVIAKTSLVLLLVCLVLTFQRAAYLTVAIIAFVIFVNERLINLKRVIVAAIGICVIFGGVFVVMSRFGMSGAVLTRFAAVGAALTLDQSDIAIDGRMAVIVSAFESVFDHPWWGQGIGNAGQVGIQLIGRSNTTEQGFLNIAYESGLIFLVVYLGWLSFSIMLGLQGIRKGDKLRWGAFFGVCSALLYGLTQPFDTNLWWILAVGIFLSSSQWATYSSVRGSDIPIWPNQDFE